MAVLRRLIGVLVRLDPAIWYALDLRRRSAASWIPLALLLAFFLFAGGNASLPANSRKARSFLPLPLRFLP